MIFGGSYAGEKSGDRGPVRGSAIAQERGDEDLAHSKSLESPNRYGQAAKLSKQRIQGEGLLLKGIGNGM